MPGGLALEGYRQTEELTVNDQRLVHLIRSHGAHAVDVAPREARARIENLP